MQHPVGTYGSAPVMGTAVACQMTRTELEKQLQASGYGANTKIYNCYFRSVDPNSMQQQPPLCVACGLPIGSHASGATNIVQIPTQVSDPSNLRRGDYQDVAESGAIMGLVIGAVICFAVGAILLIAFGAAGLIARSPVTVIGPCISTIVGFILFFCVKSSKIVFDRNARLIHYESTRMFCCKSEATIPFSDLTGTATTENTGVRVNGVPQVVVVAQLHSSSSLDQVVVQRGGMFELMSASAEWTRYLTQLRGM